MSDRPTKHEDKWALDEHLRFRAEARRNKLLGLWAAAEMGLTGEEADAYAKTVVASDMKEPGEEDVFRKVAADFRAIGVTIGDDDIHRKMDELRAVAREQVRGEAQ